MYIDAFISILITATYSQDTKGQCCRKNNKNDNKITPETDKVKKWLLMGSNSYH